jgi:UPF0716 family protein affecting phage T7 exclusion
MIVRSRSNPPDDPLVLTLRVVRLAVRIMLWYPGLLCKIISALLLIPALEKGLSALILRRIHTHFLGGLNVNPGAAGPRDPKGLKPARGRVVK